MKKLILLPLFFSAFYLSAFEVYGFKSGMTKTEFYELTNCQAAVDQFNIEYTYTKVELTSCFDGSLKPDYFEDIVPTVLFQWTHEDKLWRVSLQHVKRSGILQGIAYRRAVEEAHPGVDIVESSKTSKYGTTEYLTVNYIDESLSNNSIDHYAKNYLEELNNKK